MPIFKGLTIPREGTGKMLLRDSVKPIKGSHMKWAVYDNCSDCKTSIQLLHKQGTPGESTCTMHEYIA